jgi:nitrogen fixation-related uncharacterized protein
MTFLLLLVPVTLLAALAVASVLWGADSRGLRDHPWESVDI